MESNARKKMWNMAGTAGLILGAVSAAYLFITQFLAGVQIPDFVRTVADILLWAGKFGGCIWLMMTYMKRYTATDESISNDSVFRFGILVSILSAVVYAAASFANTAFISADAINQQMAQIMEQMTPMMDSNSMNQLDKMMNRLPQITFFSSLFYCFLYGTILSFILSRNIPSRNPFAERTSDEW